MVSKYGYEISHGANALRNRRVAARMTEKRIETETHHFVGPQFVSRIEYSIYSPFALREEGPGSEPGVFVFRDEMRMAFLDIDTRGNSYFRHEENYAIPEDRPIATRRIPKVGQFGLYLQQRAFEKYDGEWNVSSILRSIPKAKERLDICVNREFLHMFALDAPKLKQDCKIPLDIRNFISKKRRDTA